MKTKLLLTFLLAIFGLSIKAQSTVDTCRMKIGTNFYYLKYFAPEQPFVDLMKTCREWESTPDTVAINSIPKDTNGYPLQLPYTVSGQPQTVYTLMSTNQNFGVSGTYPAGTYTVLFDGTGTLRFEYDAGNVIITSSPATINITTPTDTGIIMYIDSSSVTDHIRNIRVLMPGTQSTYQTQPFNQYFLNKIAAFPVLRYMNWGETVGSPNQIWGNRATKTYYTQSTLKGCAYEYMVKCSNITQKDLWICVPHMADSTYIAKMAELVRDSLNPQLKIYLEYSNELWNSAPGFSQYNWIAANGPFFPDTINSTNHSKNSAYWAARVFRIWYNVFGLQAASRIVRVAACFDQQSQIAADMLDYFTASGSSVDAIAPAPYFGVNTFLYDSLNALPNATVADVIRLTRKDIDSIKVGIREHNQLAISKNVRLLFYEGGQALLTSKITNINSRQPVYDAQIDTSMHNLYREYIKFIKDSTKVDLFVNYLLASKRQDLSGSWGVLESVYQDTSVTPAPKYNALIDYINSCQVIVEGESDVIPKEFALHQNYPNPFNPATTIKFDLPKNSKVTITLYNILGERVAELVNEEKPAGYYSIKWNGSTHHGMAASGVYFATLRAGDYVKTLKMILLK